ncbi:MAG: D-aminoacyl-tRNA deacylase [Saprospiraceae bacterium]|nr:D-aminoacyl-tRNA deacylase [Saprospiraceae bacterium]
MKIVLQRVKEASVTIDGKVKSQIGFGLLLLLGIETNDTIQDVQWLSKKVLSMRIFNDQEGKMNLSIQDVKGEIIVVSQFTLHANIKKGTRPSFMRAARPDTAIPLYEKFIEIIQIGLCRKVGTGEFGADMKVSLVNDGPVTILMDSKNKL